jgi:ABC-type oligopeptide transport system ATPase subunit
VEQKATEDLFAHPEHPYTKILLDAVPNPLSGKKRRRASYAENQAH